MWLLPTRGRAKLCGQALRACLTARMSRPMVLWIDPRGGQVKDYQAECQAIGLPENWIVKEEPAEMADTMRWVFDHFPAERHYGWLADDLFPRTVGFDALLEQGSLPFHLADCDDDHYLAHDALIRHRSLCGAFCWSGDLVRAVGWWALPKVKQAGIDNAWTLLCVDLLPLRHFMEGVVVEHANWRTGKRPYDGTDEHSRAGENYVNEDMQMFEHWRSSDDPHRAVQRIKTAMSEKGIYP